MFAFPLYATVHSLVLIGCLYLYATRRAPGALLTAMIAVGLVYDNSIVALGATIGAGPLLEALSWPRFVMHALLTPFMMIAVTQLAVAGGIRWADSNGWRVVVWLLVLGMIAMGAMDHLIGLEIRPACFKDVLRYTGNVYPGQTCPGFDYGAAVAGHGGPPIPAIAGNILTLVVGFALWRQHGWLWLMGGALVMFCAAAVPMSGYGMAPSNGGEMVLLLSYALTAARFGRSAQPATRLPRQDAGLGPA